MYRLWRDLGYAVGALLAGRTADARGLASAIWLVAAITFVSGVVVAVRVRETLNVRAPSATCSADQRLRNGARSPGRWYWLRRRRA